MVEVELQIGEPAQVEVDELAQVVAAAIDVWHQVGAL